MRKSLIIIGSLVILVLVLVGACARAPKEEAAPLPDLPMPTPTPSRAPVEKVAEGPAMEEVFAADVALGQVWATERMIVRTATLSLEVESVAEAVERIEGIAGWLDGYVVSSTWHGKEEERRATISIRVPTEKYDEAMKELHGLAVEVISESTKAKDVTEEYVDLQSRLRNLEATEEQYLVLMERAETVEEMLKVQWELSQVRGDIEETKGRMQYLERTSATSLIEIHLEQAKLLEAEFVADKIEVEEGEKVNFTNQTEGGFAPYGYRWDFGDGSTSTEKNPTHAYDTAGSYTVSLKVTDEEGNVDTETKTDYITVVPRPAWSAGNIAKSAWQGLTTVGRGLGKFFVWLGVFAPIWIPIGLIIYGVNRWRRRGKRG